MSEILRTKFIPHIYVTGDTDDVQRRRPGAVVIDKPFREKDLLCGIQRALVVARVEKIVLHGADQRGVVAGAVAQRL